MRKLLFTAMALALVACTAGRLAARIKMVALPERAAALIRLDNPTATLVQEERVLTLQEGTNKVDFSWRGVHIDADSIRLASLGHPDEVNLINVSYPPGEAALVWEIYSPQAYNEPVRISYLLSNIDRLVAYKAVAEKDESELDLDSYLVLRNFSGEDFQDALVKLDYGQAFEKSIQHEETKRMLFLHKADLPIEKTFKWDSEQKPWDPEKLRENVGIPVFYTLYNTTEKGLGENALWGGKVRVYQEDGHESTIFLGEDRTGFVPVGGKMETYIGDSRDIVVTQKAMLQRRVNVRRNNNGAIILYDLEERVQAKIENFRDRPAVLILVEHITGEWEMRECTHDYELEDHETLKFRLELKPEEKVTLMMHYVRKNMRP